MLIRAALFGVLAATLSCGIVHADILLDTGPGPSDPAGYPVYGPNSPYGNGQGYQSLAGEFTINQSWTISSLSGWMAAAGPAFNFPPGPVELSASIYSNAPANSAVYGGAGQPGSTLFSAPFALSLCASADQSSCPVGWQGPTALSWSLNPGTYWVVFEGAGNDTGWAGMPGSVPAPMDNSLFLSSGQDWSELYPGGFGVQISGRSAPAGVPEPGMLGLLLTGFALLGLAHRLGATWNRRSAPPAPGK